MYKNNTVDVNKLLRTKRELTSRGDDSLSNGRLARSTRRRLGSSGRSGSEL